VALLAEEGLRPADLPRLVEALGRQPPWSDLPLLILTGRGTPSRASTRRFQLLEPVANVTLVERPVRVRTLVSAVRAALRGRRRQYDVGDHLAERERLEGELRRHAERLAETDRHKDEFLAMLGHELRNPLAPLRSIVETLRRQRLDGGALEQAYAMIDRQVAHLSRLVDDLLDVSRITRGLVELRTEPVDLARAVDQAAEMAAPLVEGRGHELMISLPRQPLWLEGDMTRLTQVFFNLLNNAAKYTEPGGKIWLTAGREGEEAAVRVRDNGTGMPPELVPKVFDLFAQGERSLDRS
jgi:signal transduction histidine kinase